MKKFLFCMIMVVAMLMTSTGLLAQNTSTNDTALIGAAKRNDLALVKKLVTKGANVNCRDNGGATVLMWAAYRDNLDMVKYLLGKGAVINEKGTLDNGSFIFGNALSIAVKNRNADMVYDLLKKCKCTITRNDIIYIDKTNPDKGFDLNLFDKGDYNDGIVLSYLFLNGLDISMFDLIEFNETEWAVKDYLNYYVDSIDVTDPYGRTLLHAAAVNNRPALTKFLIKYGVDVDVADDSGQTPYSLAKESGNEEVIKLLISNGADTSLTRYAPEEVKPILIRKTTIVKPQLGLPYGHTDKINSVNFSSDGKLIVTGSKDQTAKIWEASSGKLLRSLDDHTAWVEYVAISPDMKYVVTETNDYFVKIWNTRTGDLLQEFRCGSGGHSIFSPDSKSIFIPDYTRVKKIDVESGRLIYSKTGHTGGITSFSANNEFTLLLTGSKDSTSIIWDVSSGKMIQTLKGINSKVASAIFSHNSKFVMIVSSDSLVHIFETVSGKLLYKLEGHKKPVQQASFSSDDKYILTESSFDKTAKVWSTIDGRLLYSIDQEVLFSNPHFSFSPDSRYLLTVFQDNFTETEKNFFCIWDIATGKLLHSLKTDLISSLYLPDENKIVLLSTDSIRTMNVPTWQISKKVSADSLIGRFSINSYSPDKNYFLQTSGGGIMVIDIKTGFSSAEMFRHAFKVYYADYSKSMDSLIIVSEKGIKIIDARNANEVKEIFYNGQENMFMSPYKNIIALTSVWHTFEVYDLTSGKNIFYPSRPNSINYVAYDPSGSKMAAARITGEVYILECRTGKLIKTINNLRGNINYVSFSPYGKYLGIAFLNGKISIFNTSDYSEYLKLSGSKEGANSIEFSHNGKLAVSSANNSTAFVWDLKSGMLLDSLIDNKRWLSKAIFTPDDKFIITSSSSSTHISSSARTSDGESKYKLTTYQLGADKVSGTIKVWDTGTRKLVSELKGHSGAIEDISFSPDGKFLLSASTDRNAIIWDCSSWKLLFKLEGHKSVVNSARFSPDSKLVITASDDSRIKIWDPATGKEILTYIPVDTDDWVVMSPSGLFDATPGALNQMYYVQGLDVIDLDQIKERYYEPKLWSKLMGFNDEPARDVKGFDEIKMYPEVTLSISNDNLNVALTDRGGGIGQYMIYINGKEAYAGNLKKDSLTFRGTGKLTSAFNLKNHPYLIPGKDNQIMVKAFNGENYLVNRGENIEYSPAGEMRNDKPRLFLLTAGVSDYTGDQIDLRFAAKDADDITNALVLGAKKLFGSEETFIYKLTTNMPDKSGWPTKENIKAAFINIAGKAKSSDIVVVYVSGHGISIGDQDGDFYYLTQDAYTANAEAYKDKSIRDKTSISSAELTEMIKKIPALKQVLIIDACGSGKTVENLIARRDISSSTLRALDRMKDRTGLHIITGCAADAVSYEASRYGQGVLTYSLLEGMKGASLREDKFADVIKLFQYSRERVPELAKGIGGIQQPQTFSPFGEASFDIGEFDAPDKSKIPLALAKSIVLMSSLKDKESFDDILGIEKLVDDKLREISSANKDASFVFVEARDFPDAFKIRGQYSVSGNNIEVTVNVFKGTVKTGSFVAKGIKNDLLKLTDEIVRRLTF